MHTKLVASIVIVCILASIGDVFACPTLVLLVCIAITSSWYSMHTTTLASSSYGRKKVDVDFRCAFCVHVFPIRNQFRARCALKNQSKTQVNS